MSGINSENSKARELKKFHRNGARACFHRQSTPATVNHSIKATTKQVLKYHAVKVNMSQRY